MGTFYGDVLTNLFFIFGDVFPNSGGGGGVTRERFDLHPFLQVFYHVTHNLRLRQITQETNSPLPCPTQTREEILIVVYPDHTHFPTVWIEEAATLNKICIKYFEITPDVDLFHFLFLLWSAICNRNTNLSFSWLLTAELWAFPTNKLSASEQFCKWNGIRLIKSNDKTGM